MIAFQTTEYRRIISTIQIPRSPPSTQFPSDVLKYMKNNATLLQAIKLMEANKYFIQEKCLFNFLGSVISLHETYLRIQNKDYTIQELPNNLGVDGSFFVYNGFLLPQIIPKISIFYIKSLNLKIQQISFNDFKFLTSSKKLTRFDLNQTKVILNNDKNNIVPYEILLEHLTFLRHLQIRYHRFLPPWSKKFAERICDTNLEKLFLEDANYDFEFETFLTFLKKKPNLDIHFKNFYCDRLNAYIEKLFFAGLPDFLPPLFNACGTKQFIMICELRKAYHVGGDQIGFMDVSF